MEPEVLTSEGLTAFLAATAQPPKPAYIRFNGQSGKYLVGKEGNEIKLRTEVAFITNRCEYGWIKFNEQGQLPDRIMGSAYNNFAPPARDTLGLTDPSQWKLFKGKPSDPWSLQYELHLYSKLGGEYWILSLREKHSNIARDLIKIGKDFIDSAELNAYYPVVLLDAAPVHGQKGSWYIPHLPRAQNDKVLRSSIDLNGEIEHDGQAFVPEPTDEVPY